MPTHASTAVRFATVSTLITPLPPPSTNESETIQPVTLLPRIEPRMMLAACRSVIMPLEMKPMAMMLVAVEDWITAVTAAPSAMPLTGWLVRRYKTASSLPPATWFRPSPISMTPYRNSTRPQSRDRIAVMTMESSDLI